MATTVKTNGQSKKETATAQNGVQKQLAEEAVNPTAKNQLVPVSLEQRIDKFEKLRGLASQRERVVETLTQIARFNYNSEDSCTFFLRDIAGLEFKTTNSNLIKMVASELQRLLESKREELEQQILSFEL